MIRRLAQLSLGLLLISGTLAVVSAFRPLDVVIHDQHTGNWFHQPETLPESPESFNEPLGYGSYPHPAIDVGVCLSGFFVRSSQFVPTQIQTADGTWIENPDNNNFEPFHHQFLGIAFARVWHQGAESTLLLVPRWLVLGLLAIMPAWSIMKRRRQLKNNGLCLTCHYDVRAQKPGSNCPECGTTIPVSARPKFKNEKSKSGGPHPNTMPPHDITTCGITT